MRHTTTTGDIARLRELAAQGYSRIAASRIMGRYEQFGSAWAKREHIAFRPPATHARRRITAISHMLYRAAAAEAEWRLRATLAQVKQPARTRVVIT